MQGRFESTRMRTRTERVERRNPRCEPHRLALDQGFPELIQIFWQRLGRSP